MKLFYFFLPIVIANPFKPINEMYVNPTLTKNILSTIKKIRNNTYEVDDHIISNMMKITNQPSAYWIDKTDKIKLPTIYDEKTIYVEGILHEISLSNKYKSVAFIVYNLPNRDCKAIASNGKLCCNTNKECNIYCNTQCQRESTECNDGLDAYKYYINTLYDVLNKYPNIRKILIIEPDSLPNCVTNIGINGCNEVTCDAYKKGIKYAIDKLYNLKNVYMYLDIAHGGWLGWENNLNKFIDILSFFDVSKLQGFSTNTANYQILGDVCKFPSYVYYEMIEYCKKNKDLKCCYDPCNLHSQYSIGNNELNYAQIIYQKTKDLKFGSLDNKPHFVIDTGRNGNTDVRIGSESCKVWCNVNNAKIGVFPTTDTSLDYVDAYAWLKTPGESDGCIDYNVQHKCSTPSVCNRYDSDCGNFPENIGYYTNQPCPPEAGYWFDYQIIQLNK